MNTFNINNKNYVTSNSIKNKIIDEKYLEFENEQELNNMFGQSDFFQNIIQYLADGYLLEQLTNFGITNEETRRFEDYLKTNNLTIQNAIAINQYSNGSNMILSLKKGIYSKKDIQLGIMTDLFNKLMERRHIRYNCYR